MAQYWIVVTLMIVLAISSMYVGFSFGRDYEITKKGKELTEECRRQFMEQYLAAFAQKFNEQVEEKSNEIAVDKIAIFIDSLPEEQQNWFKNFDSSKR